MSEKQREIQTAFRWRRDAAGYDLSPDRKLIVRRGGALIEYEPAEAAPKMHREFADLIPLAAGEAIWHDFTTPGPIRFDRGLHRDALSIDPADKLLDFVDRYGFLGSDRSGADAPEESIGHLLKVQTEIQHFADSGRNYARLGVVHGPVLRMSFEADKRGRTIVRYRPESLYAWLWLRVADDLSSGVKYDGPPCLYCGNEMGRGPGGHRTDAKFCSEKHKTYFNRLPVADQRERRWKARELQRSQKGAGT